MSDAAAIALALMLLTAASWGAPALVLRLIEPRLRTRTVPNYRGAAVYLGLGWAWVAWEAALALLFLLAVLAPDSSLTFFVLTPRLALPVGLVGGVFLFGWIDDRFGDSEFRGFRGHLAALRRGRVTTGLLKLLGIGVLAVVSGAYLMMVSVAPEVNEPLLLRGLVAAVTIAATANFVNLTDLRPGRALKTYVVLAVAGVVAAALSPGFIAGDLYGEAGLAGYVAALVLLLGPAVAIWPYDLGERGMLGDAGANAAGALAGYVLASALPLWALAVAAIALVALNLASERVSFSKVIERVGVLRALDRIGRLREAPAEER